MPMADSICSAADRLVAVESDDGSVPIRDAPLSSQGTAHKCGLFHAGMLIHAIDGTEIRTLSMDQVVALLKGQPGSTVSVTVSSHLMAFQSSAISPSSFSEEAKDAVVERFKQLVMNKDFEVTV